MFVLSLASNENENNQCYACLALAVWDANKETEAAKLKGSFPVLPSKEEAKNLAAATKEQQEKIDLSKTHKLSQQVPLWSTQDVREWVEQIGFSEYADNFVDNRVDGDLLLQLTEDNLIHDIGLNNGIRRRRFTRELQNLKKNTDYNSKDGGNLKRFLQSIGPEFSIYTYNMLNAGIDEGYLTNISEDQLRVECGIHNSIHRSKIMDAIKKLEHPYKNALGEACLNAFVSYRRSNGSQLASLLKVHLELRGYSVFIDVERLEAGKFDNNLLQSIKRAQHFLLVLTPQALERCVGDEDGKDWVHKEIATALNSQCNIIPIIDDFQFPEPETLPEDMRQVCHFNGVRWIHDYQDACVDKVERFMRGEIPPKDATWPNTSNNKPIRRSFSYERMQRKASERSDKDSTNGREWEYCNSTTTTSNHKSHRKPLLFCFVPFVLLYILQILCAIEIESELFTVTYQYKSQILEVNGSLDITKLQNGTSVVSLFSSTVMYL